MTELTTRRRVFDGLHFRGQHTVGSVEFVDCTFENCSPGPDEGGLGPVIERVRASRLKVHSCHLRGVHFREVHLEGSTFKGIVGLTIPPTGYQRRSPATKSGPIASRFSRRRTTH
jgi:hypothetical protein